MIEKKTLFGQREQNGNHFNYHIPSLFLNVDGHNFNEVYGKGVGYQKEKKQLAMLI